MGTGTSIVLTVAVVATVGIGAYFLTKRNRQATLTTEKADRILMGDVVAWFKSLNLDPDNHTPFICNNLQNFKLKSLKEPTPPYILLGVYNEKNNSLSPYKLIEYNSMDSKLEDILKSSSNGLVVLS